MRGKESLADILCTVAEGCDMPVPSMWHVLCDWFSLIADPPIQRIWNINWLKDPLGSETCTWIFANFRLLRYLHCSLLSIYVIPVLLEVISASGVVVAFVHLELLSMLDCLDYPFTGSGDTAFVRFLSVTTGMDNIDLWTSCLHNVINFVCACKWLIVSTTSFSKIPPSIYDI